MDLEEKKLPAKKTHWKILVSLTQFVIFLSYALQAYATKSW